MSKPESAFLRNVMITASAIGALVLSLSAYPLSMSPHIFDSGQSATAWAIFASLWLMPAVLIGGLAVGWAGFARNQKVIVAIGLVLAAAPALAAIGILVMAGV